MAQERLKHLPKFTLCPGAQVSLLALPEMQSNKEKQVQITLESMTLTAS